ncbi:terminase TerL endonuclease subunit, partial [Bacillus cereus group sp. BfR-BA-01354]
YQYVSKILDPNIDIENEEYFVMVNELDKDDEITNPEVWEKANPILCSYEEGRSFLKGELQSALDVPEKMRNYLTKNMNRWVDMKENGYMDMQKWKDCKETVELSELKGLECTVGVDLSAKIDLTSISFEFKKDDKYIVI